MSAILLLAMLGAAAPSQILGHYHGQTGGASTVLEIEADGRCRYSHQDLSVAEEGSGRIVAEAGGAFRCRNAPGPVRLDLAAAPTRDPRVALTLDVRQGSGWPADKLALAAGGRFRPFDHGGRVVLLREAELGGAREVAIVRAGDRRELWRTMLAPGGPNRFLFTYAPSDVEPVDVRFRAIDARGEVLRVDVGSAGAEVRRMRFTR